MSRWCWVLLFSAALLNSVLADDKPAGSKDSSDEIRPPKTGRPGENTPEEEEKLDAIINAFIEYDLGLRRDKKALREFEDLGPEAIPALIRGLNRSASYSHSCPVTTIGKKLKTLLRETEDERVLQFARDNIGGGLRRGPYTPLMNDLKFTCMLRARQLDELRRQAALKAAQSSPGERGSGGKP